MNRNYGIDFLKFICTIMVICIHTMTQDNIGKIVVPIARCSVPIFFMITGYYYSLTRKNNKQKKQIYKIFKYIIWSNILYLLYNICICWIKNSSVFEYAKGIFNFKKIINFICFNESPFAGHLWYLSAILYVLIIIYLWEKRDNIEKLHKFIPILLLLDLIFGKYSNLILKMNIPYIFVRNFVCVGLPYFLIGDYLFKHRDKIKLKTHNYIGFIFLFSITTLMEKYFIEYYCLNTEREHYISTTFLAIFIFLLMFRYENVKDKKINKIISCIGGKLSLGIYIIHPMIIGLLKLILKKSKLDIILIESYNIILPVMVFVISIIISYILFCSKSKIIAAKNKFYRRNLFSKI